MDSSRNHIDDEGGRNNDGKMSHIDSKERWWVILITSGTISHIEIIKIFFMKFRGRIRVSWTVYNWLIRLPIFAAEKPTISIVLNLLYHMQQKFRRSTIKKVRITMERNWLIQDRVKLIIKMKKYIRLNTWVRSKVDTLGPRVLGQSGRSRGSIERSNRLKVDGLGPQWTG